MSQTCRLVLLPWTDGVMEGDMELVGLKTGERTGDMNGGDPGGIWGEQSYELGCTDATADAVVDDGGDVVVGECE